MNNKALPMWKVLLSLAKVKITFAVALTTITGYALAQGGIDSGILLPTLGVFLLACGSAALNQIQERHIDLKMERTRHRPLPSGRISLSQALLFMGILLTAGSLLLYYSANLTALLLGWLTLLWYNAIYTPLKRVSAFAVVPGSVIGALPPAIGWVSAGANLFDTQIIIVALFFFLWQIPHFWLIMLKHSGDYKEAGFPTITDHFSLSQIHRLTLSWVLATAASSLLIAMSDVVSSEWVRLGLVIVSLYLIWKFLLPIISSRRPFVQRKAFITINIYSLLVMVLLVIDTYIA
jgi:heme o synthase